MVLIGDHGLSAYVLVSFVVDFADPTYQRARQAIRVLHGVMAMIPRSSVLFGVESISE